MQVSENFRKLNFQGSDTEAAEVRQEWKKVEHGNSVDFFGYQAPKGRKKGRVPKTVNERRAYSPEGYCISPHPA